MRTFLFLVLLTTPSTTYEADVSPLYLLKSEAINPFENIWNAQSLVESNCNPYAVGDKHLKTWSYGIVQIRQERLDDYFRRTGIKYTTEDVLNIKVSKEIYMYYAQQIGPYDLDRIIRNWNGSGPMTYEYLKLVKNKLKHIT